MAKENAVVQMYGSVSGTAAVIDVPDDGFLINATLMVAMSSIADNDGHIASLEFGSTNSNDVNDTRGLLGVIHVRTDLLTSGALMNVASQHFMYGDPGIKVFGGERLYLHNEAVAGTFLYARAILVFNFATFVARRR